MSTVEFERRVVRDQQPADDPLLEGEQPDRILELEGLGIPFRLETNDPRIEQVALQAFGPRGEAVTVESPVTLRLLVHDLPEDPSWQPLQPVLRAQGDHFYVAASRASVVAGDLNKGFAFGFISDRQASHEEHLRSTMMLSPFLWMATARSLSAIHCAAVRYGDTTIMLRGKPNAGKTTLAYAALRQGFSLLCEDVAFAWRAGDDVELRGMPWLLYLKPDAVSFFPELDGLPPLERYNGESKILVQIRDRFGGQVVQRASLGPTVFVERSPENQNVLHPLPPEDALIQYEETRIAVERRSAGDIDIWGRMLDQPVFRFEVGPDPLAAAEVLKDLCQG